jgi:hypothetical protein
MCFILNCSKLAFLFLLFNISYITSGNPIDKSINYEDYEIPESQKNSDERKAEENYYYYENTQENSLDDEYIKKIRLNRKLQVNCAKIINSENKDFVFKEILFNQSLVEFSQTILDVFEPNIDYKIRENNIMLIKNKIIFGKFLSNLDGKKKPSYNNNFEINSAKYSDSGHYYCIYTSNDQELLLKSFLYVIYDGN